jgi:hypothetical protein
MAQNTSQNRQAEDLGSRSPASEEAQQQGMSGNRGAQAEQSEGAQGQPAQASNRRPSEHEQSPEQRKHFPEGHAPSEQGEKDHPSPHVIAQHQQGIGRQSGSHAGSQGDRSEEAALEGEPRGEHARHGRQDAPGSREQNQE